MSPQRSQPCSTCSSKPHPLHPVWISRALFSTCSVCQMMPGSRRVSSVSLLAGFLLLRRRINLNEAFLDPTFLSHSWDDSLSLSPLPSLNPPAEDPPCSLRGGHKWRQSQAWPHSQFDLRAEFSKARQAWQASTSSTCVAQGHEEEAAVFCSFFKYGMLHEFTC